MKNLYRSCHKLLFMNKVCFDLLFEMIVLSCSYLRSYEANAACLQMRANELRSFLT